MTSILERPDSHSAPRVGLVEARSDDGVAGSVTGMGRDATHVIAGV